MTPWIHVHWVRDANSPSHPLPPPSPFAFNFSQHQGLLFLNIHNIKFPILTILGVQLSGIEPVHMAVQLLSPSISRTFSSSQSETQHPLNKNSSFTPPFTTPSHHCSTFCFYEFDNFRHLIWVESYCICPFVTSWFHLACYPQGSSSCFVVVGCVWISFPGHFFSSSSPSLVHSFNFCHPLLKIETWRHNNVQDSDYIKIHTHTPKVFLLITNVFFLMPHLVVAPNSEVFIITHCPFEEGCVSHRKWFCLTLHYIGWGRAEATGSF